MVNRSKPRLIACSILVVMWLAVIWGNSMTTGQVSGEFSGWASRLLGKILPFLSPDSEYGHLLVRKLAHFSEFAILGILLRWLFAMLMDKKLQRFIFPLVCGMACAIIDEFIQSFTPGRVCSFWDMCIDWSGVLTGILLTMLTYVFIMNKRNEK